MDEKADILLVKRLNEIRLLNLIREQGPISRNELARKSDISKVAVSDIINRLIKSGYVLEIGKGQSTSRGGKRPIMLKLNPVNGYVVGIEIKRRHTTVALADIESTIVDMAQVEYDIGIQFEACIPRIIAVIEALLQNNQIDARKLVSIGIGIPGFVDYIAGQLMFADTLQGWAHKPLAGQFAENFHTPVIVENDVNAITLGENLIGAGKGWSNLICIWIGEGIGAGIIMDGQLIRGATGNAGEIGYTELGFLIQQKSRIKNLFHGEQYFGEILSEANLFGCCNASAASSPDGTGELTLEALLAKAESGDAGIREILEEYGYLVAVLCMNLIKTVNPGLIILSGRVMEHSNFLLETIRASVQKSMVNIPFQPSSLVRGKLKKEAGVQGAIALALQTIFEPPVKQSKNHLRHTTA
ncbi:MAG: ROK family transcriptional regulator [Candidatus Zhuqueibacterota bacterium]